ncbi:hypothetical protein [Sphingobacterium deserti]|uniref:Uncharacterized protein n=1 Tax=Sphingobacterium deserti TaxID=1229276 RepID=A0A0B8T1R1_9SPHI|nr:hypothetical protein [Sphingobacterium deserti]KGE14631.1 hypothetical protein DI53_1660 [Sphingobacterium deserti]
MNTIILQAALNDGTGSAVGALIAIGISLLIFFILRSVMLWYWKVDKIVENQQKQIQQMNTVIEAMSAFYRNEYPKNSAGPGLPNPNQDGSEKTV